MGVFCYTKMLFFMIITIDAEKFMAFWPGPHAFLTTGIKGALKTLSMKYGI